MMSQTIVNVGGYCHHASNSGSSVSARFLHTDICDLSYSDFVWLKCGKATLCQLYRSIPVLGDLSSRAAKCGYCQDISSSMLELFIMHFWQNGCSVLDTLNGAGLLDISQSAYKHPIIAKDSIYKCACNLLKAHSCIWDWIPATLSLQSWQERYIQWLLPIAMENYH